jgi:hypothetical protein
MVLPVIASIAGGVVAAIGANRAAKTQSSGGREAGRIQDRAWQKAGTIGANAWNEVGPLGENAWNEASTMRGNAFTDAARLEALGFTQGAETEADAFRTGGIMRGEAADGVVNMLSGLRDTDLARYQPFADAGNNALRAFQFEMGMGPRPDNYGGFTATPSYDFRRREGLEAVERSVAGRQGLASGAAMQSLQRAGQDYASLEYDNYLGRMRELISMGYSATDAQAMLSQNAGTNIGRVQMSGADARAAGLEGAGRALADGIRGAAGARSAGVMGRADALAEGIMGSTQARRESILGSAQARSDALTQGAAARAGGVTSSANARAAGTVGMTNAFTDMGENLVGLWQNNRMMNAFNRPAGAPSATPAWNTSAFLSGNY